jgi:hypothetical protein
VANGATGILTAGTQGMATPDEARRAWPQWLALGLAMIAVGVTAVLWDAAGARLLLGAAGLFLVARGAVLLVAVPVLLLAAGVALLSRSGAARRGGQALLVWTVLVTGLLVATGVAQGWARASDVATVVAALAVAVLGVPLIVASTGLRRVAAQPQPPARPAACAGCACGAGGCGALG